MKIIQLIDGYVAFIAIGTLAIIAVIWMWWYIFDQVLKLFRVHKAFKEFIFKEAEKGRKF